MTRLTAQLVQPESHVASQTLDGLLTGLEAGPVLSWGLLEVVALRLTSVEDLAARQQFATPEEHLKLAQVPTYGTVVLRNTSPDQRLIVPMHIGFFQPGAQNHATSRALALEAGETLPVNDCFCIQAHQGGLLQEAQQRFVMLPLGLRQNALAKRGTQGFSWLWADIDGYTRQYGLATGGHLERFLRPNFDQLLPLRHALEPVPGQVGAAYFVAGRLAGVEVVPNETYWQELSPILAIYCYGPEALRAERRGYQRVSEPLDLGSLLGLDDLAHRLRDVRAREARQRTDIVNELATLAFDQQVDEDRHGLRVATFGLSPWLGQAVRDGRQVVYASVFRDVVSQLGMDRRRSPEVN
ncbi:MAG: ARPP-1 family domain-containing protein [Thermoguttaceae bacterium]